MNIIVLVGRLTADPELLQTESGIYYSRFTIAVDRPYVKQGEDRQADFINVVAWRSSAEFLCKYFIKGQRIGVQGSVRTGSFIDENGIKRYTFYVHSDRLEFVERKDNSVSSAAQDDESIQNEEAFPYEEDLPF